MYKCDYCGNEFKSPKPRAISLDYDEFVCPYCDSKKYHKLEPEKVIHKGFLPAKKGRKK